MHYGFYDRLTKDFPSQINVDLIDRCNYACIHCAYSVLAQEKKLAHAQLSKELNLWMRCGNLVSIKRSRFAM